MILFFNMKKYLIFVFILFLFCSEEKMEKKYSALQDNLKNLKNNSEKAEEIKKFLLKFPESSYTYDLAIELIDYEKPGKVEIFIKDLINKIKNESIKDDLRFCLLELFKKTKDKEKIMATLNDFNKPLDYYKYSETIKALLQVEAFEDSLNLSREIEKFCKKENIDKELEKISEERRNRTFKRRNFEVEFLKARAYLGLGEFENALVSFNNAKSFLKPSFVGTYMDNFNYYFSILLNKLGKNEDAISTILPDVIFEKNNENYGLFEEIYFEIYKTKDGIEEFLKNKKAEISPNKMDFKLKDYNGEEKSFLDLSKEKVTLLTFWFPT